MDYQKKNTIKCFNSLREYLNNYVDNNSKINIERVFYGLRLLEYYIDHSKSCKYAPRKDFKKEAIKTKYLYSQQSIDVRPEGCDPIVSQPINGTI